MTDPDLPNMTARLEAMERRFAALDSLLRSMTDVLDGLTESDAALLDTMKALSERVTLAETREDWS